MKLIAFGLLVILWVVPAQADILVITEQGNTIMPEAATEVSMDAEKVVISPGEFGWGVDATFEMRSQGKTRIQSKVAFPVVDPRYGDEMKRSFKVEVRDGVPKGSAFRTVPVELKMKKAKASWEDEFYFHPAHDTFQYPGFVVWDVSWEPGETKTIHCTYDMGEAHPFRGLVDGWSLLYVVRTGVLWKGPIGKADIRIRFKNDVTSHRTSRTPLATSYPQQAKWISPKEVQWIFSDWKPTEDIWVKSLGWVGFIPDNIEHYFLALPIPYQGDKKAYTEETITQLVERELDPWKPYFPDEVAKIDRKILRKIVAGWLYHEMFARRGDPFLIGKCDEGGEWPKGTVMATEGYCYGEWHTRFEGYMYHGGWYHPKYGPKGTVRPEDLSPQERQNAEFLKKFL